MVSEVPGGSKAIGWGRPMANTTDAEAGLASFAEPCFSLLLLLAAGGHDGVCDLDRRFLPS